MGDQTIPGTAAFSVGHKLPDVVRGPISRTTLALFAGASGDHNPIHLDEGVAQMAGLPSIILHGLCTMAFVHDALVRKFGPDPLCVQRLAVRFLKPVLMGDRLTIDVRGRGKSLWLQVKNQLDVVVLTGAQVQIA